MFQPCLPGIQCQLCHMMFSDQSAISAHYDAVHGKAEHPDARHPCHVCDRKFVERRNVKRHLAKAHGIGDLDREVFGPVLHVAEFDAQEIDDVIDPKDSRKWIMAGLRSTLNDLYKSGNRPCVDSW